MRQQAFSVSFTGNQLIYKNHLVWKIAVGVDVEFLGHP
jgi:hypothetical protein